MHTITAALVLDDTADPLAVALTVQVDGATVASRDDVSPADAVATLQTIALGDADLRARLLSTVESSTRRLQDDVARERAAQKAREAALAEWQKVLHRVGESERSVAP